MKALISPNELHAQADGAQVMRVCEVRDTPFDVAPPLFWVDCPDDTHEPDVGYLDGAIVLLTYPVVPSEFTMPVADFSNE